MDFSQTTTLTNSVMLKKSTSFNYLKKVQIRDKINYTDLSNRYPNIDSLRLFVTRIPSFINEKELRKIFEKFGEIYELNLLRDKKTGESKGCGFVTYFCRDAALQAQKHINRSKEFSNMTRSMIVKVANLDSNERKLFIGMLSRKLDENDLIEVFSVYGMIEDCIVLRDPNGVSRGCAFITYREKKSALNAIKYMHRSQIMENCSAPINVRFADTNLTKRTNFDKPILSNQCIDINKSVSKKNDKNFSSMILFQQLIENLKKKIDQIGSFGTFQKKFQPLAFGDCDYGPLDGNQENLNQKIICQNVNPCSGDSNNNDNFISTNSFFSNQFCHLLSPTSHGIKQIKGPANSNIFIYHLPVRFLLIEKILKI